VLFYALLSKHLEEMFPVIYTPTEADAIANYSHLFRRSEGLYLHPTGIDTMEEDLLDACEGRDLDLVSCRAQLHLDGRADERLSFRMLKPSLVSEIR
jgi:hypothetical protein